MKIQKKKIKPFFLLIIILIIGVVAMAGYKLLQQPQSESFLSNLKSNILNPFSEEGLISPIRTAYNEYYEVLSKTGNESLFDVTFESKQVSLGFIEYYDEESEKNVSVEQFRKDEIICLEAGWDEKEIVSYKDENQTIVDKNYTYPVPSTLSFYKAGFKQTNLIKNKSNMLSATSPSNPNTFCYQANPDLDYYLKFGDNSVIVIQGQDVVGDSFLTNVTAETGDANFTHLNISTTPPYNSLVGYWNFDGDAENTKLTTHYDFTKQGNDGIGEADAIVNETDCLYGDCLELDGVGDDIIITDPNIVEGISEMTISVWVRLDHPNASSPNLKVIRQRDVVEILWATNEKMSLIVMNSSGSIGSVSSNINVDDFWHHYIGTYNGSTVLLYVDSVLQNDKDFMTGSTATEARDLHFGSNQGVASFWNGSIDEVMFFNTSLTQAQVSDIYNNQSARFFETGEQSYDNNSQTIPIASGNDEVNVTTIIENNLNSKVNLSIAYYDGSWTLTAPQTITSGVNYTYTISSTSTNLTLNYTLIAGNSTDPFYTPLISGDIILDVYSVGVGDVINPNITINSPKNITYTTSSIVFNITALDETELDSCWVTIDGGVSNLTLTNITYINDFNATNLSVVDGNYLTQFYCNDTTNNINNSETVNFTMDTVYPEITIAYPTNLSNFSINTLSINYTYIELNPDSCWYSNDTYAANTSLTNCETNITDVTWVDGDHNITVWINDSAGYENSSMIFFTIDTILPEIYIDYPVNYTNTTDTGQDINYTASDTNLESCWYSNDSNAVNTTLASCTTNITTVTWSEGIHNITIWANDSSNNQNSSMIFFTIDTTPPEISLTYPTNTTYSNETFYLNYTYTEANPDSCWYNNGTDNSSLQVCGTNWTGIIANEGSNNWTVWINDSVNYHNSSNVSFFVDTTLPQIVLTYPTNTTYTNETFSLNYTYTELNPSTCWYYNGSDNSTRETCGTNWTGIIANQGSNTWTAYINDTVNNQNSSNITFFVDSINPYINITYPLNNTNYDDTGLDVNYTVTDTNLDSCWYSNDSYAVNTSVACGTNITGITWTEGTHNITIWANDSANNVNNSYVNFSITVTVDSTNPNVTINSPENTTYSSSAIEFNVTALDEITVDSCWATIDGGTSNLSLANTTYVDNFNATNTSVLDGGYHAQFYCNDTSNNINDTETVDFLVDTVYPNIAIIYPPNLTNSSDFNLNVNFSYSDLNVDGCWWTDDYGTTNISNPTCLNLSGAWITGMNNVTIYINDSANNVNSTSVSFTISIAPPDINITYPQNFTNSSNTGLNVNYTTSDTLFGVDSCWYTNDSGAVNTTLADCLTNITDVTWSEGIHNVTVWVNDSVGNENSSMIFFTIDTVSSIITITNPLNNSNLSSAIFDLNYTFTETNPNSCWYSNNSGASNSTPVSMGTNWTALTGAEGNINRTIYCNDTADNENSMIVYFTIDLTLPDINITYPTNNTDYTDTGLNINYTTFELNIDSCWYSNDTYAANTSLADCSTNITDVTWTLGIHNVTIWVNDSAGNENSSYVNFSISSVATNKIDILFSNQTDLASYKIVFQEGEDFKIWGNWTDENTLSINATNGKCDFEMENVVYENESVTKDFTLCDAGQGCDQDNPIKEEFSLDESNATSAVEKDIVAIEICHEQGIIADLEVTFECGAVTDAVTITKNQFGLCADGFSRVMAESVSCMDSLLVNLSLDNNANNYPKRHNISKWEVDRAFMNHNETTDGGKVRFNATYNLWEVIDSYERYEHGSDTRITLNCSHSLDSNYDNETSKNLTIVNQAPIILPGQVFLPGSNYSINETSPENQTVIEYKSGEWEWIMVIVDDDIDTHNETWYNSSGYALVSDQHVGLASDHNTSTELFTNFTNENVYNLTVWANDTFGNMTTVSFYFNVTDTTDPVITNPRNFTQEANQSFSEDMSATDELGISYYWLNQTNFFTISQAGIITNATNLSRKEIHWLNYSVNDSVNNIQSLIFYINLTEVSAVALTPNVTKIFPSVSNRVPYIKLGEELDFT